MHASGFHARHVQGTGFPRPAAEHRRVIAFDDLRRGFGIQFESNSLRLHEPDAALHHVFGQLHVGDAVHEQPAGAVRPFDHGDGVPHLVQPIGGGKTRRAAADDGHGFPCAHSGHARFYPALFKARFDQIQLVVPVGHAVVGQIAGLFAQGGTYPARKLREGGGAQQPRQGFPVLALIDQIVPFRDQVMQGASEIRLTEGHAAVHAAGRLAAPYVHGLGRVQIVEILDSRLFVPVRVFRPGIFQKSGGFTHTVTPLSDRPNIRRRSPPGTWAARRRNPAGSL